MPTPDHPCRETYEKRRGLKIGRELVVKTGEIKVRSSSALDQPACVLSSLLIFSSRQ